MPLARVSVSSANFTRAAGDFIDHTVCCYISLLQSKRGSMACCRPVTALLVEALRALGLQVTLFSPIRLSKTKPG